MGAVPPRGLDSPVESKIRSQDASAMSRPKASWILTTRRPVCSLPADLKIHLGLDQDPFAGIHLRITQQLFHQQLSVGVQQFNLDRAIRSQQDR